MTDQANQVLAQLEQAMHEVSLRRCPCGHTAEEHSSGGCPCGDCDLRTFEVEQGSVYYADRQERVGLAEHLARIRSSRR